MDTSRPANDQIAAAVKAAILSMRLTPGQMISEKEVGQLFGASRTPVREAFAMLREENLIVTRPSRGTFVTKLSVHQITSAQFLREAIEVAVVERLCQTGVCETADTALHANLEEQRRAVGTGDKSAFQTLDDQFHLALAGATGLGRIQRALTREKMVLDRLRVFSLDRADNMSRLYEEHDRIFKAIRTGDLRNATRQLRDHLRLVLGTLSESIAANRAFFDLNET
ncbi:DNA-binding transcriptional regulator, GntR family [Monaibacterium marinum]|uniref:DNA-binding transcriptional regulator, GntR family n=2 Tax=Pontivivens marinum TaxID=1690039 RepID=A0A2C9CW76_9RHOB|nr:DNA-binding transcriptional regulator, GntR family [Monaibacterium marinum]